MADAPKYPDFSQPSIMNPKYGPRIAQMLGPLIREFQRQQQFGQAFGVSPRQAIKPTPEETQRMLNVGLAFGGADITKEQREAWEAENTAWRMGRREFKGGPEGSLRGHPPGTRVRDLGFPGETPTEAVVVDPKAPGEKPGFTGRKRLQPSPAHIAIRHEGSDEYYWRHPDEVEALPPKEDEWAVGTEVLYPGVGRHEALSGTVGEPPKSRPNPGRPKENFVWLDLPSSPDEPPRGGWFHKKDLQRKK